MFIILINFKSFERIEIQVWTILMTLNPPFIYSKKIPDQS